MLTPPSALGQVITIEPAWLRHRHHRPRAACGFIEQSRAVAAGEFNASMRQARNLAMALAKLGARGWRWTTIRGAGVARENFP